VAFRRPVLLPTTVVFGTTSETAGISFGVTSAREGSVHLVGRVTAG